MIELLVAYILVEGGAGTEWWALYAGLLVYKVYYIYHNYRFKQAIQESFERMENGNEK